MAVVTGAIVPDQFGARSFRVQLKFGSKVIADWPVGDEETGRRQLLDILERARDEHDEEGRINQV